MKLSHKSRTNKSNWVKHSQATTTSIRGEHHSVETQCANANAKSSVSGVILEGVGEALLGETKGERPIERPEQSASLLKCLGGWAPSTRSLLCCKPVSDVSLCTSVLCAMLCSCWARSRMQRRALTASAEFSPFVALVFETFAFWISLFAFLAKKSRGRAPRFKKSSTKQVSVCSSTSWWSHFSSSADNDFQHSSWHDIAITWKIHHESPKIMSIMWYGYCRLLKHGLRDSHFRWNTKHALVM